MLEKLRVSRRSFQLTVWGVLVYLIFVVLWGAVVRATGSGAGCGDHWPLCNGKVVPRAPELETLIEFGHRLTSGMALIGVIVMMLMAFASFPKKHIVRKSALASLVLIIVEALIGAGIVLFELVAENASIARGISMALHLVNTFLLLAAVTLTGWWASHEPPRFWQWKSLSVLFVIGFLLLCFTGMTGGVVALGDTLFPRGATPSLKSAFAREAEHIFLEFRIWHPLSAVFTSLWWGALAGIASLRSQEKTVANTGLVVFLVVLLQLVVGVVNVLLRAPVWMQVTHLFIADVLLISCVVFASQALRFGLGAVAANESVNLPLPKDLPAESPLANPFSHGK
jgi:heme a synthase